ncbi:hypothetical protein M407DRAFT_245638 [Tulasnella calospora MUT 4182]|uniref:Uncharacterized protein n=1 Tax=Tulasnella calospora MUT 4182 TaxID=1051891 RepID=A0A0C3QA69_9AGAM|nr:hypothetical protein M407DRAFT_245638 [Tulasnella calospora MUT 4182]
MAYKVLRFELATKWRSPVLGRTVTIVTDGYSSLPSSIRVLCRASSGSTAATGRSRGCEVC